MTDYELCITLTRPTDRKVSSREESEGEVTWDIWVKEFHDCCLDLLKNAVPVGWEVKCD